MFNTLWYDSLTKPLLTPPAWVFSVVWIILYGIIFVSLVLFAIKITNKNKFSGYTAFLVHMVFNLLWSPVFFLLKRIDIALFIILIIIFTAFLFIKKFYSVSKISGLILLPYFLWLIFALYLNIEFLRLN